MESSKVYVNVMAEFTNDGRLLPRSFIWKDGHVYEIQKVTDVRRAASLKAGGAANSEAVPHRKFQSFKGL